MRGPTRFASVVTTRTQPPQDRPKLGTGSIEKSNSATTISCLFGVLPLEFIFPQSDERASRKLACRSNQYEAELYRARLGRADGGGRSVEPAELRTRPKIDRAYDPAADFYFLNERRYDGHRAVHRNRHLYPPSSDQGHYQSGEMVGGFCKRRHANSDWRSISCRSTGLRRCGHYGH